MRAPARFHRRKVGERAACVAGLEGSCSTGLDFQGLTAGQEEGFLSRQSV